MTVKIRAAKSRKIGARRNFDSFVSLLVLVFLRASPPFPLPSHTLPNNTQPHHTKPPNKVSKVQPDVAADFRPRDQQQHQFTNYTQRTHDSTLHTYATLISSSKRHKHENTDDHQQGHPHKTRNKPHEQPIQHKQQSTLSHSGSLPPFISSLLLTSSPISTFFSLSSLPLLLLPLLPQSLSPPPPLLIFFLLSFFLGILLFLSFLLFLPF